RGIVAGDLSARVTVDGSGDAFDNLAGTLNAMLDRTEQLMDGMRQVSNDIAHDFRTALAVLRSRLERLVDSAGAGRREGLADGIKHTDEILRIFEALLRIAAIDARTHRSAFADVDLSDVARNVAEIYEPLAEENDRKIVLEIGPDVHVHADRQLLAQALANLVDNALK